MKSFSTILICATTILALAGCEADKHPFSEMKAFESNTNEKEVSVPPPAKPNDAESWFQLGFTYQSKQQWPQTIYCYKKTCELDRTKKAYWNGLGSAYQFADKLEPAREAFLKAHALDVFEMGTINSVGFVDTRMGKYDDEALRFYLMALAINPTQKEAWDNLVAVYHRLDKDDLIPLVQKLASSPTEPHAAHIADRLNENYLSEHPDDFDCLVNRGMFNTRFLNVPLALEAFDKAAKLRPDDPRVLMGYGFLYDAMGDDKKAEQYFAKCTSTSPSQAMAWANRGAIAFREKRYKQAQDFYAIASALSPEKAAWSGKIAELDPLVKKQEEAAKAI